MLAPYSAAKAKNRMTQDTARLRSLSTRKLMIGFLLRISQKIRKPSPSTNARTSVCTRPNGSPSQSHSCPLLSMISQAGHDQHQHPQADEVEVQRPAAECGPLLIDVFRVPYGEISRDQGEAADGDVDEEDPAPVVIDAEPAAQGRPDDGGDDGGDRKQRHGRALLLGREAVHQDALAARLEPAPGQPLDHPEQDHLPQAGREPARRRGEGEAGDRQAGSSCGGRGGTTASR